VLLSVLIKMAKPTCGADLELLPFCYEHPYTAGGYQCARTLASSPLPIDP
jgi:hypothetical protein